MINRNVSGSFRDPSGFLFYWEGQLYRQVNKIYQENYDYLIRCGLYEELVNSGLLIPHIEVEVLPPVPKTAYKVIKPEVLPFISYPYEWCFSQLKDAALTTLKIQKKAFEFGMSLKDGSAYNIQFQGIKPILIDSLSFERYREGEPWVAYKQFCQHFLAPLALMSYNDVRLSHLLKIYLDGIPLDLTSSLLPFRSRLRFSLLTHIHLHARSQKYFADKTVSLRRRGLMGRVSFQGLIDNLEVAVRKCAWKPQGTQWADYYEDNNYSAEAFNHKKQVVADYLERINPQDVSDLGSNNGAFSRLAGDRMIRTLSLDLDPAAVEKNYLECLKKGDKYLLPLCLDLTNPSPGIGWNNTERLPFLDRNPGDTVIALALIHHLAIANNTPLDKLADFFRRICKWLIIEFVPKSDSQVQRLLASREDIFSNYTQQDFEEEFENHFEIHDSSLIVEADRTIYLMQNKGMG